MLDAEVADILRTILLVAAFGLAAICARVMIRADHAPRGWYSRMASLVIALGYVSAREWSTFGHDENAAWPLIGLAFVLVGVFGVANIDPRWIGQPPDERQQRDDKVAELERRLGEHARPADPPPPDVRR